MGFLDNLGGMGMNIHNAVADNRMEALQFGAGILANPGNFGAGMQQGLAAAMATHKAREQKRQREEQQAKMQGLMSSLPPEVAQRASALPPKEQSAYLMDYWKSERDKKNKLYNVSNKAALVKPDGTVVYRGEGDPHAEMMAALDASQKRADKVFAQEGGLRKEFDKHTGEYRELERSYNRINDSATDPSAAGDVSMIFAYMKMLDPTSVVREGEQATAANAGSIPERIWAQYNRAMAGERLHPSIRQDYVTRAGMLLGGQKRIFDETVTRYKDLSSRYGVNPENVVSPVRTSPNAARKLPEVGEERGGYKFLGGDPKDPNSWKKQ